MRKSLAVVVSSLMIVGLGQLAQAQAKGEKADKKADAFVGTWSGSWTGGSEGTLELTISKGTDGTLGGSITPSPANGDSFTATLKSVVVEDKKLTATFDSPDGGAEATLTGTLEDGGTKGSYTLKEKSQGSVVETGTWTAKKK